MAVTRKLWGISPVGHVLQERIMQIQVSRLLLEKGSKPAGTKLLLFKGQIHPGFGKDDAVFTMGIHF